MNIVFIIQRIYFDKIFLGRNFVRDTVDSGRCVYAHVGDD